MSFLSLIATPLMLAAMVLLVCAAYAGLERLFPRLAGGGQN